jgi:hypothetical protein
MGNFTVMAPDGQGLSSAAGPPGTSVEITGTYFGSKKPKVYFGYVENGVPKVKRAKVVSSSMDPDTGASTAAFLVPGVPAGVCDVIVQNRMGEDVLAGAFTVTSP